MKNTNIDNYFNKHIAKFDENKFEFRENIGFIMQIYAKSFVQDFLGSYNMRINGCSFL
jgi:hypothetical protein